MRSVPVDDRGLLLGDGLFETLLWRDGELVDFEAHAGRMIRGCAVLGLPAPDRHVRARAAVDAGGATGADRAAVRLSWTAGSGGRGLERPDICAPRLFAAGFAAPRPEGAFSLATVGVRRNEASPLSRLKSLAYLDNVLARREAKSLGAQEALMLNTAGEIACAAAANLFWFSGGRLRTPALACGVLDGVMRGRVLARAADLGLAVEEVAEPPSALDGAEGLFVTNSLIGARAVSMLDGRPVAPSPLFDQLGFSSSW
jgi:branched-chain amino acid aminotransferase/4-amino-4-deoxychorismate lyase